MKTIIAGPRDFTDTNFVWRAIAKAPFNITEVVSGHATGVDAMGETYAIISGIPVKRFPADWKKYGKAAGPIRNNAMAEYADALIAIDTGSRGTAHMIRAARTAGLEVYTARIK